MFFTHFILFGYRIIRLHSHCCQTTSEVCLQKIRELNLRGLLNHYTRQVQICFYMDSDVEQKGSFWRPTVTISPFSFQGSRDEIRTISTFLPIIFSLKVKWKLVFFFFLLFFRISEFRTFGFIFLALFLFYHLFPSKEISNATFKCYI